MQLLQHLAQCNQLGFNENERLLTFPDVSNATLPSVSGLANLNPQVKNKGKVYPRKGLEGPQGE